MKHILTILFIIAILAIAFIVAPNITDPTGLVMAEGEKGKNKEELPSFMTYTEAVCDNVAGLIVCHDELFASCGDFEYRLPKNDINGNSVFDKDWKDPRKIN